MLKNFLPKLLPSKKNQAQPKGEKKVHARKIVKPQLKKKEWSLRKRGELLVVSTILLIK